MIYCKYKVFFIKTKVIIIFHQINLDITLIVVIIIMLILIIKKNVIYILFLAVQTTRATENQAYRKYISRRTR